MANNNVTEDSIFDEYINQYSLSKTLRFKLIPQGKTLENLNNSNLIDKDKERAEYYKKAKEIIDEIHKYFINTVLNSKIKINVLDELGNTYNKLKYCIDRNEKLRLNKLYEKLQSTARQEIVKYFETYEYKFKNKNRKFLKDLIKPGDLFKNIVPYYYNNKSIPKEIQRFDKFSTYFSGFSTNRKNIYLKEEKSTAIAYRIININFEKYYDNFIIYCKIKKNYRDLYIRISEELSKSNQFNLSIEDFFDVDKYVEFLSQEGIDLYNQLIGGFTLNNGDKVKGVNEYLNLYSQKYKAPRYQMNFLQKQILSDSKKISFVIDNFKTDKQVIDSISTYTDSLHSFNFAGENTNVFNECIKLFSDESTYDLNYIYISSKYINDFSKYVFPDEKWSFIKDSINNYYDTCNHNNTKNGVEEYSILKLTEFINDYNTTFLNRDKIDNKYIFRKISNILLSNVEKYTNNLNIFFKFKDLFVQHKSTLKADENNIAIIKNLLDSIMEILHILKFFDCSTKNVKDSNFYSKFDIYFEELFNIVSLYNKTRNYCTKKIYSVEKYKLNFNCSTFLDGWDENKVKSNLGTILIKDNNYYLCILNKNNNKIFESTSLDNKNSKFTKDDDKYKRIVYKQLSNPVANLPRIFLNGKGIGEYKPNDDILRIYKNKTFLKGKNFKIDDCYKLIDFYKQCIIQYEGWNVFNFKFSNTESYNDISDFFKEISAQAYKITFSHIDEEWLNKNIDDGNLYLFQIYNKDFSKYSTGNKNLHTLYFENLFSNENLENIVFKMNGQAEMFYRPLSIDNPFIHKKNNKLVNKTYLNSKGNLIHINNDVYLEIFKYVNNQTMDISYKASKILNEHPEIVKEAKKDLIKDRRFTKNQIQLHLPITINFNAIENNHLNRKVLDTLYNKKNYNIIGIDRGERHLIYLSVINQDGKILKQESLNILNNVDYRNKLDLLEKERLQQRQSWKTVSNIKELKSGYLSLVVNKMWNTSENVPK